MHCNSANSKKHMKTKSNYLSAVFGGFSAVLLLIINKINRLTEAQIEDNGGKLHFFCNHIIDIQSVTRHVSNKIHFSAEMT